MGVFNGAIAPSVSPTGKSVLSPVWSNTSVFYRDSVRGFNYNIPKLGNVRIDNCPILSYPTERTGSRAPTFADDFYNRIHLNPQSFNVGNLVNETRLEFKVFNAYFENRQLTQMLYGDFDGIELLGKIAPATYKSMETQTYTMKVTTNGPAKIDATLGFVWDTSSDTKYVKVKGSRAVLMPFRGTLPFSVEYSWLTSINNSRNKTESRSKLRKEPRMKVMFNAPIADHKALRHAQNLSFGWLSKQFVFPMWYDIQKTSIDRDETFIPCTTDSHWFVEGMTVILWKSYLEYEMVEVGQIASNGIHLVRPVTTTWKNVHLMPTVSAETKSGINIQSNNVNGTLSVTFDVINSEPVGEGTFALYKGHELWLDELQIESETLNEQLSADLDVVDFKVGNWKTFCYQKTPNVTRTVGKELESLDDLKTFKEWLWRRAGKFSAFWMPSYRADFKVVSKGQIASTIECSTDSYLGVGEARKNIIIFYRKPDGTIDKLIRGIVGAAARTQTTMVLSLDLSLNIDASTIHYISFLTLNRLADDTVKLNWEPSGNVTCYMPVVEIDQ